MRSYVLAALLVFGTTVTLAQPVQAQTAEQYCNQYTPAIVPSGSDYSISTVKVACYAGLNGSEDCQDFALSADQMVADICKKAYDDRKGVTDITGSPKPSPSPSVPPSENPTGSSSDPNQAGDLSEYLDMLHETGPDAETELDEIPDDTKGEYINGAGNKQKIETVIEGKGNSPALLILNGGGWHSNDKNAQRIAAGEDGAEKAGDRGYAIFDVTYRLGSSGVYDMYEDVMRGINHMMKNADMYGIDPERVVIWGDSAGGSLAMRAAASGKTGAKVAVGWSAPTNAYTGLFHSFGSIGIGADHSTCAPTDLAGLANFADLLNGGSGDVAQYGMGLSSNDFSALGIDGSSSFSAGKINPLTLITQGMVAGKNLTSAMNDMESISSEIRSSFENGGSSMLGLAGSTFNLAGKKFNECLDNFNALSPALFASPDTPPSFLAGFENDGVVSPNQPYGMRDKLRQLGIKSDAMVLPGSEDCVKEAPDFFGTGCHLGYYKEFVCPTLNFIDSIIQPDRGTTDCGTGVAENLASNDPGNSSGGGSSGSSGGGGGGSGASEGSDEDTATGQICANKGGIGGSIGCTDENESCDTWDSSCNGGRALPGSQQSGSDKPGESGGIPAVLPPPIVKPGGGGATAIDSGKAPPKYVWSERPGPAALPRGGAGGGNIPLPELVGIDDSHTFSDGIIDLEELEDGSWGLP